LNPNGLIPEEALKMSNTAFGAAIMLIQEAEDKLDKGEMNSSDIIILC